MSGHSVYVDSIEIECRSFESIAAVAWTVVAKGLVAGKDVRGGTSGHEYPSRRCQGYKKEKSCKKRQGTVLYTSLLLYTTLFSVVARISAAFRLFHVHVSAVNHSSLYQACSLFTTPHVPVL
jgi:hypothetical protein